MTSAGRKIAPRTVENYLADVGLRYYLLGTRNVDQGHILENIVYLLTMDNDPPVFYNGIRQKFVLDWLLGK